jgi:hypothetical protein
MEKIFEPLPTGEQDLTVMISIAAVFCLILGGNAAFSFFAQSYVQPVIVGTDRIETPMGTVYFKDLVSASIEVEGNLRVRKLAENVPEKILVLERRNGRGVILAERQYPIRDIKAALDAAMQH